MMERDVEALTAEVMRDYAAGRVSWAHIRETLGVADFRSVLARLGDEGLRLPRAPRDRPSNAKAWLAEALRERRSD